MLPKTGNVRSAVDPEGVEQAVLAVREVDVEGHGAVEAGVGASWRLPDAALRVGPGHHAGQRPARGERVDLTVEQRVGLFDAGEVDGGVASPVARQAQAGDSGLGVSDASPAGLRVTSSMARRVTQ